MLLLKKYPDPFLTKKIDIMPLYKINDTLRNHIKKMFILMYELNGGGLAANQVGLNLRFFIMHSLNAKIVAINPVIINNTKEVLYEDEGCLSFPGITVKVKRFQQITMRALNEYSKEYELNFYDYESRCIQHEIDHLNGITFIDHLSRVKQRIIKKKYKKINHYS